MFPKKRDNLEFFNARVKTDQAIHGACQHTSRAWILRAIVGIVRHKVGTIPGKRPELLPSR